MNATMATPANSSDQLQRLMELRSRKEILERWLASEVLIEGLQQSLRGMLREVEEQLRTIAAVSLPSDVRLN
jgi:hypothetical protein